MNPVTPTPSSPRRPTRTCVGCQKSLDRETLVRFVLGPDGALVPDLAGGAFGRGAWVHPSAECVKTAVQRGFARAFRAPVTGPASRVLADLAEAACRRVTALLRSAAGAKKLVIGATAVEAELRAGHVELVVVARDARAAVSSREVLAAIHAGRAAAFADKAELGRAVDRNEVAILGVLDAGLARALQTSIALSLVASEPAPEPPTSGKAPTEE
jgi:uncharacterized protein